MAMAGTEVDVSNIKAGNEVIGLAYRNLNQIHNRLLRRIISCLFVPLKVQMGVDEVGLDLRPEEDEVVRMKGLFPLQLYHRS